MRALVVVVVGVQEGKNGVGAEVLDEEGRGRKEDAPMLLPKSVDW